MAQKATQIIIQEGAAPAKPLADTVNIYAKTDGRIYSMDDTGEEYHISGGLIRIDLGGAVSFDAPSLAAQTLAKITLGFNADSSGVYYIIPPSALHADLISFETVENATKTGLHSIDAINDGARIWKNRLIATSSISSFMGIGLSILQGGTLTLDPPAIADQILYTTTVAQTALMTGAGLSANDLIIIRVTSTLEAGLVMCPAYLSGASVRISLHAVGATDGVSLVHSWMIIKNPPTTTVSVNPPNLAAQICARIAIVFPANTCKAGDVICVIPPIDLEADLIYLGCHVTGTDTAALAVHSIGAIDGATRDWKFVIFPGILVN